MLISYVFFKLDICKHIRPNWFIFSICSIFIISSHIFPVIWFLFLLTAYIIIGIVLFFDFVDGQLARAEETKYKFGNEIDNYNPDLMRIFYVYFQVF